MVTARAPIVKPRLITPVRKYVTEEEFVARCDEDVWAEWKDGEVTMASPASLRHVDLAGFLLIVMRLFARQSTLGVVLGPEFQVRLAGQRSRRVPDILFVSRERQALLQPNHLEGAPDLALEIASPESLARDWREKYLEYEVAGVREYWVIDPMAQQVEAYALAEEGHYRQIKEEEGALHSQVLPGFYLRPEWLWLEPLPDPLEILGELGVV